MDTYRALIDGGHCESRSFDTEVKKIMEWKAIGEWHVDPGDL